MSGSIDLPLFFSFICDSRVVHFNEISKVCIFLLLCERFPLMFIDDDDLPPKKVLKQRDFILHC